MMNQIKHAFSFILGVLYTSCLWFSILHPLTEEDNTAMQGLCLVVFVVGSVAILVAVAYFLYSHWREE